MSGAQVLVIDDEADIRALIQEILSEEGYGVTVAADAGEARSARREDDFDLLTTDPLGEVGEGIIGRVNRNGLRLGTWGLGIK